MYETLQDNYYYTTITDHLTADCKDDTEIEKNKKGYSQERFRSSFLKKDKTKDSCACLTV